MTEVEILPDGDYSFQAAKPVDLMTSYVFHGVHFPNPGLCNSGGWGYFSHPEDVYNLECRKDDVFVCSYPKNGNTWAREIVYRILVDPDVKKFDTRIQDIRCPDLQLYGPNGDTWKGHEGKPLRELESPRIFKCHYPWNCMPKEAIEKNCKIIFIARNYKDTAVSGYSMMSGFVMPDGETKVLQDDLKTMLHRWQGRRAVYGGYFFNVLSFWEQRQRENVLFMFYEEMVGDPVGAVKKICSFLERKITEEQLQKIVIETSFDKMKMDPSCNWEFLNTVGISKEAPPFMRKGKVGNWKEHFDDEMSAICDDYIEKYLQGTGLTFQYE